MKLNYLFDQDVNEPAYKAVKSHAARRDSKYVKTTKPEVKTYNNKKYGKKF